MEKDSKGWYRIYRNQLLRIEEELGDSAVYPGMKAFNVK